MNPRFKTLIVIVLLVITTLLMTHPVILNLETGVPDLMDAIFDMWVISRNVQKMINLEFHDYFDANIFFPYKRTLAFSSHYFTQSLMALPLFLITKNPVFTYNLILLLSFFTSALGMFFLARYLTGSHLSGTIAAVIYAFSPFMISHIAQLQFLSAGGIPLAFLFLHKYFKQAKVKHLLLFALFYVLQFLTGGYLMLYLTLFCGLYIMLFMVAEKKYRDRQFWIHMGCFLMIVLLVTGPFMVQYLQVRKEFGFSRPGAIGATLTQFLAANSTNWLYGRITQSFRTVEGALFPGLLAVLLALSAFIFRIKKGKSGKPIVENHVLIYSALGFLSFLFCFGFKGPYVLLHKYVPGFSGMRVAQRFHIMVMFALAVLAALGLQYLLSRIKKPWKYLMATGILALILLEYLSIPIPISHLPREESIPPVYHWLRSQEKDKAIIELPIPRNRFQRGQLDMMRMYYSLFHRKKMVNGRSSYFPPLYNEIGNRWIHFSLNDFIKDLNTLGIDYLILDSGLIEKEKLEEIQLQARQKKQLELVKEIGDSKVYRLLPDGGLPESSARPHIKMTAIDRTHWTSSSNINSQGTGLALDGDTSTVWLTGPQKRGYYFLVDMGQIHRIRAIRLRLSGQSPGSYPIGYKILVSENGLNWKKVAWEQRTRLPIEAFLHPKKIEMKIDFAPHRARYVKIINTRKHRNQKWSISELQLFE